MKRVLVVWAAVLMLALSAFGQKSPQTNTRSVQGVVTDASDAPVERAVVQMKDTKTLQIRSFITRQDGTYHFHGLSPDVDYELKADYQGASSDSRTLSSFDSRKEAVINLKVSAKK